MIELDWTDFKTQVDSRGISINYVEYSNYYYLTAYDKEFKIETILDKSDATEFETYYKPYANVRLKENATLKAARGKATTTNGVAMVTLIVPTDGRVISEGSGWFDNHHADDFVKIIILDPVDTQINEYYDKDMNSLNQGSYIPPSGIVDVKGLTGTAYIPGGFKIQIIATKGDLSADVFRCNIKWGKR